MFSSGWFVLKYPSLMSYHSKLGSFSLRNLGTYAQKNKSSGTAFQKASCSEFLSLSFSARDSLRSTPTRTWSSKKALVTVMVTVARISESGFDGIGPPILLGKEWFQCRERGEKKKKEGTSSNLLMLNQNP